MTKPSRALAVLSILSVLCLPTSCESMGEDMDDAGDDIEDAAEDVGDDIEDAVD